MNAVREAISPIEELQHHQPASDDGDNDVRKAISPREGLELMIFVCRHEVYRSQREGKPD